MSTYTLNYIGNLPDFENKEFSPALIEGLNEGKISNFVWDPMGYTPDARFYAGWNENGIYYVVCADEKEIQSLETRVSGSQCVDSCLEFFFNPNPDKTDKYINIEINPAGIPHIGIGEGRHNRVTLSKIPEGMVIKASKHTGSWWAISCIIPIEFINTVCPGTALSKGNVLKGNFYKCDESIHPHFGTWNAVKAEKPDFHRPECFGDLILG